MNVLITGAYGFIGKNLTARLRKIYPDCKLYLVDVDTTREELYEYTKDCDFVYNFAAVHRPKETSEFDAVNHMYFDSLLGMLKEHDNNCPVLYTSSIQATNGTEYGNSKLAAEADLREHSKTTGARAVIYRLTNTFGRWATPNHHSVVATFCYNLVKGIPLQISDRNHVMEFYYIDDVIDDFVLQLSGKRTPDEDGVFRLVKEKIYRITLGELADLLYDIKKAVDEGANFKSQHAIGERMYKTYLSYVKEYSEQ